MGRKHYAGSGAYPRKLLYCYCVHDVVSSRSAVFNGKGYSEKSERSHLLDCLYGKSLLLVYLRRQRLYFLLGKLSYHLPEKRLRRCEFEIHIL